MEKIGKYQVSRQVIFFEAVAFSVMLLLIWVDEVMDIPYRFFGAVKTPVNWQEALFESILIGALAVFTVSNTHRLFNRMKYIEGILPICAMCKKVRVDKDSWRSIEAYIHERSEADFSHSICPECAEKYYPDLKLFGKKD